MEIDKELVESLMRSVRTKSRQSEEEIKELVEACIKDLEIAGVYVSDINAPLCKNALKLYCKANFGYDADSEKFRAAYQALKDSMALSGDYKKVGV